MHLIGRRNFPRGLGLGAGAALLSPMTRGLVRHARGATPEKRFIVLTHACGWIEASYTCVARSETDFDLGPSYEALAPFKKDFTVVSKLYNPHTNYSGLHGNGWTTLSVSKVVTQDTIHPGAKCCGEHYTPSSITLDRYISKQSPFSATTFRGGYSLAFWPGVLQSGSVMQGSGSSRRRPPDPTRPGDALWEDSLERSPFPGEMNSGDPLVPVLIHAGAARPLGANRGLLRVRQPLTIGREWREDPAWLCLGDDDELSRSHVRIVPREAGFVIEDLGARNGTFIDGARLIESRPVELQGAWLRAGRSVMRLRFLRVSEVALVVEEHDSPLVPVPTLDLDVARLHAALKELARGPGALFLEGSPGAGRSSYAEAVHRTSRREGPFITIHAEDLADDAGFARLLGKPRAGGDGGWLQEAAGGTLFLHRLDLVPLRLQERLLGFWRTLLGKHSAEGQALRSVRLIASGSKPLVPATGGASPYASAWREMFSHRRLRIPSLAHRMEDLGAFCAYHLGSRAGLGFATPAWHRVWDYAWPGNLTQLVAVLRDVLARVRPDAEQVAFDDLPLFLRDPWGAAGAGEGGGADGEAGDPSVDPARAPVPSGPAPGAHLGEGGSGRRPQVTMARAVELLSSRCKKPLPPRVVEVLVLTALGHGRKSVASELGLAPSTVTNHLHRAAAAVRKAGLVRGAGVEGALRATIAAFEELANS